MMEYFAKSLCRKRLKQRDLPEENTPGGGAPSSPVKKQPTHAGSETYARFSPCDT